MVRKPGKGKSTRRAVRHDVVVFISVIAVGMALLLSLNSCQGDTGTSSDLAQKKPQPLGPSHLRIALIRLAIGGDFTTQLDELTRRVQSVIVDVGNVVDVIVTPEYSLTSSLSNKYDEYAIEFSCDSNFNNCTMATTGGVRSAEVLSAIESLQLLAIDNRFYLFLGTVIERFDASAIPEILDPYVYFNDLVIIDPQGQVSIKRKTNGDWQSSCGRGTPCHFAIEEQALSTVRSYPLVTRDSELLDIFAMICGERFHPPMLAQALNQGLADLDVLIGPEREGDTPYEAITEAVQNGTWDENMFGWELGIESGYVQTYVGSGLLRQNAYLAAAEGGFGTAGLINLANPPAPVSEYIRTSEYLFGAICTDFDTSTLEPTTWGMLKTLYE